MRKIANLLAVLSAIMIAAPFFAGAQVDRSYYYESISQKFTVNEDTTVDVEETQTYRFNGEYNKGWRSIPLNKVSDITEVEVIDAATLIPLVRVFSSLDKTDPVSWGKYYVSRSGGNLNIEWYYRVQNESRGWILKYRLIGGVSFLKEKDELYWNLLTDYDVPVLRADATVVIPGNTYSPNDLQSEIYVQSAENPNKIIQNNRTYYFSADNIATRGVVTIAAGWPEGLLGRGAFWRQFLLVRYVPILLVFIILATIIFITVYWYRTEKVGQGRGTIVPEYEPPRKLPPAMAEVIVREKVTPKGWAATVVDLAVRGHVKITEQSFELFGKLFASWIPKNYVIERADSPKTDPLQDYEKKFMEVLMPAGRFSTKEVKIDRIRGRQLYVEMKKLEKELYKETELDTNAYAKPVSKDAYSTIGLFILLFGGVFSVPFGLEMAERGFRYLILVAVVGLCSLAIWLFVKFEARLSAEGAISKEEWLGFKMYLEKAEKYRLQNLTPETFEKFLPYAIIFGVEKQWGKAFEGITLEPPNWYSSTGQVHAAAFGTSSGGFSSGFSASAFSASFSSSFTSAFSSSGGAGASGGGGGAGGGGGGGGGGAS